MSLQLAVVVPAFNEEGSIEETIVNLRSINDRLHQQHVNLSIIVVNDASADKTPELAVKAGADVVVHHKINLGLGAAVRTGLQTARNQGADIVVKFDADLQHEPEDIINLIEPIIDDQADVVYGNRFERIEYTMPPVRRIGNKVFTGLMRWLTKWELKDSQPGIFAINKSYLERFFLPGDYNYTQQILLDAYHKNMRFAHVAVTFRKREKGKSFISLKYPLKVLPQIFMVLIGVRPLKVFAPIAFFFLATAGSVFVYDLYQWIAGVYDKPATHVNLILGTGLFGLQCLFFGALANLIVVLNRQS